MSESTLEFDAESEAFLSAQGVRLEYTQRRDLLIYAGLLAQARGRFNLVGPRSADAIFREQILDCLAPLPAVPNEGFLLDVGTGPGLPGVVWAIARPNLRILMLEPREKRYLFVRQAILALDLRNARVVPQRMEEPMFVGGLARTVDVIVSRAVMPDYKLAPFARALLRPGTGKVIVFLNERPGLDQTPSEDSRWVETVPYRLPGRKEERYWGVFEFRPKV